MVERIVGFDAHHIGSGQGGNETYSRETVRAWSAAVPQLLPIVPVGRYRVFCDATGWTGPVERIRDGSVVRWSYGLTAGARRRCADVLHTTYYAPVVRPKRLVVTVHDTSFRRFPEWFPKGRAAVMDVAVSHAVAVADVVIAISQVMADDIAEVFPPAADKVRVVRLGGPRVRTQDRAVTAVGPPFLLYVGNLGPRKNLKRLVAGFASACRRSGTGDLRLKIAGTGDSRNIAIAAIQHGVSDLVDVLGRVSGPDLAGLYATAHAVVCVSLYEGFGLPVAEALAYGKPVVASDIPAHREVAGATATYANPSDTASIADAIEAVVTGSGMNLAGIDRINQLSWEMSTVRLAEVYDEVIEA